MGSRSFSGNATESARMMPISFAAWQRRSARLSPKPSILDGDRQALCESLAELVAACKIRNLSCEEHQALTLTQGSPCPRS